MKHFIRALALGGVAISLAACPTAKSGDDGGEGVMTGEAVTSCPQDQWITLADYPEEILPTEADNATWLAANAKRKGVTVSDTGLQSNIIKKGLKNGATPQGSDSITAHYYGYFPDGERFDDSYSRNDPLVLPNDAVISGWTEALRDMKVCEARIVYIPGDLAYGPRGRPGIPPNATLIFKMQLLGVAQ